MSFAVPGDLGIKNVHGVRYYSADETFTDVVNAGTNSTVAEMRGFHNKIFYINNGSNQTVVFTIQSSPDIAFTDARTVGSTISVAASGKDEIHISDLHSYMRINIDPAADSTGTITINLRAQQGSTG